MSTSASPAPESSDMKGGLRVINGRAFNDQLSETLRYSLPADEEEHSRLDIQHNMIKLRVGGLYNKPDLIKATLAEGKVPKPAILDIGTGSGSWAMQMAVEFPHADVLGIDIATPAVVAQKPDMIPPNCTFKIGDANKEVDNHPEAFDLVHVRLVWNLEDYHGFIYQIARNLRPGGVLILIACTADMETDSGELYPALEEGEPGFRYYPAAMKAVAEAGVVLAGGKRGNSTEYWTKWLKENPLFDNVSDEDFRLPAGPAKDDMSETEKTLRGYHNFSLTELFKVWTTVLIKAGMDPEKANRYAEGVAKDLKDPTFSGNLVWRYTTAIRNDKAWIPREGGMPPMINQRYGWSFEKKSAQEAAQA